MDKLKTLLVAAVAMSIVLICMLMVFILSATKETRSEVGAIVAFFAILVLAASAIIQWVKYFKRYVNFTIEQKLREINKKPED